MDISKFLLEHWGISGKLKKLPGYEDVNYFFKSDEGNYLLKITKGPYTELIDMQVRAMEFLGHQVKIHNNKDQVIRLLPWLEGKTWARYEPKTPNLLFDLGKKAADHHLNIALFQHNAAHRQDFKWDLAQSLWIEAEVEILDEVLQQMVGYFISQFKSKQQIYDKLPKTIIHNDLNDYNILVQNGQVTGFIDYGDMCYSQRINDVAILLTYAMMDQLDPIDAAVQVLKGFTSSCKLTPPEIDCLLTLIGMRLAVSLVSSQKAILENPENEYLAISRAPAIELISELYHRDNALIDYKFKWACDLPIFNKGRKFDQWIETHQCHQVCAYEENDYYTLDLGVGSLELGHEEYYNDAVKHEQNINNILDKHQKSVAIGSFNEVRPLYSSDDFTEMGNEGQRWRTVHIGLDFFKKAGTEVYAFADGEVHALKYNEGDKNYGNTVILHHGSFYTLYGHMSANTLSHLKLGQKVKGGELIAWFGAPHENGNWAPHLHFQIILDMLQYEDDFPGVCYINERSLWTQLSPDPRPYLGLEIPDQDKVDASEIVHARKQRLGRSYSLSYDDPLHILRAHGTYLYDETGRKFLDCVNNVPHVGHQNTRVVEAATRQMQLLNTNTRYLHRNIVELSERLTATLPEGLHVCHFVNSGSEANELAIRMARVATGRRGVVAMEHGYHGNTNLCVDISSYKFNGKGGQGQKDFVQLVPMPDPLRPGSQSPFSLDSNKERPSAFIHESILSCGGQVVMPDGFFSKLYDTFRQEEILMIADEVQTGLGRIGDHMWAFQAENIIPDIVTIGKPFGNGHPLAAVVCTEEVADAFHNGMEYFNTFGGNPVSCSIGLEVLKFIEENSLQNHALDLGQFIKKELKKIKEKYPAIADVRGRGLFLGWEFAEQGTMRPLAEEASFFVNEMKRLGVLLSTDGPYHNVIKFKPPMVFTRKNAEYMLDMMDRVMNYF